MTLAWKIIGNNSYFSYESDGNFLVKYEGLNLSEYFQYFGVKSDIDFIDKIKNDVGKFYEISPIGEVKRYFYGPLISSLDDYLYLTGLYVIENGAFYLHFISEAGIYGRAEVKTNVVFENLEFLGDIILPFELEGTLKKYNEVHPGL